MKNIALLLALTTLLSLSLTACSNSDISNKANEAIDKAIALADEISIDDIKQKYVDSGLKDAVDDLVDMVEKSYETYDYLVDTSSLKELYHGEDDKEVISIYADDSGKVYLLNYVTNKTTVFTGEEATKFLNSYIEKATNINLDALKQ